MEKLKFHQAIIVTTASDGSPYQGVQPRQVSLTGCEVQGESRKGSTTLL